MKIQRKINFLLPALVLIFALFSSAHAQESGKIFLWKVKSNSATAYILGSIHFLKQADYPLDSRIEDAFKKSDTLVVELDVNADFQKIQNLMLQHGVYRDNDSLKNHLPGDIYGLLAARLKETGIDPGKLDKFKPWMVSLTLVTLELAKLGYSPQFGIDKYFLDKAGQNKKILALESPEYQMSLFSNMTEKEQQDFLFATLKEMDLIERELNAMIAAWKSGDAKTMDEIMLKDIAKYPQTAHVSEKLVYGRNKTMASKIKKFLSDNGTYFIIIGSGHLTGNRGIIELLSRDGFAVEQM